MTNEDGMLSQEEIDALLGVSSDNDDESQKRQETNPEDYLSSIEIDALGEIGNISFGSSATSLSTLLNNKVEITTPVVSVIEKKDLRDAVNFQPVSIQVNYVDGFIGKNVFVIKANDAAIIADIMLGGDGTNPDSELNEIHLSAVQEAMNQMMGAAATSMSTVFNKKVDISPPSIIDDTKNNEDIFDEEAYVKVFFRLTVGDLVDSNMMQLMPVDFAKQLVNQLLNPKVEETPANVPVVDKTQIQANVPNEPPVSSRQTSQPKEEPIVLGKTTAPGAEVKQATFSEFEKVDLSHHEQRNLDMLLDIPLNITVQLGRTKRSIRDILDFSSGSIIELDKLAGEPVDILVNNKLIAEGEVVVIEENFGVRVTDIISKSDRLMKLK